MTAPVPLSEQIAEVEREIRQRCRVYPKLVADGRYKQETADAKLAAMRATQSTLIWLEANEGWVRTEAVRRRAAAEADAALRSHPAVAAVLAEFPDATIAAVRTLPSAGGGTHDGLADAELEEATA